jgi:hypothetical protein
MDLTTLEARLLDLNYRWSADALTLWRGTGTPRNGYRIYDGEGDLLRVENLAVIDGATGDGVTAIRRSRLRHGLIDHYLQREMLPHELEMRTWMRGAKAVVDGDRIPFKEIIPWCQKSSTYETRRILQKETGPLCKFLKPFALNYWTLLLEMLKEAFGFGTYVDYCRKKKGIDYGRFYDLAVDLLDRTGDLYFPAMEHWTRRRFHRPLSDLNRFDAIKLLSLEEFDDRYPDIDLSAYLRFFNRWGIDVERMDNLRLELGTETEKTAQGMSFFLKVPEEVHVLMRPQNGWIDLETLFHELGHGLSAAFTSPHLPAVDRNMATSFSLSEAFAFLLQRAALSQPFLREFPGCDEETIAALGYHRTLRDLSVFRRYAAKFVSEYEMFRSGDLENGQPYADHMARHTGFYHQPESHLFDLVPEFYSLDYLLGWMGAAMMESTLRARFGDGWFFRPETGDLLREWWGQGNRQDIFGFLEENGLGPLTPAPLLERWQGIFGNRG